jgi:7-cyano-7-deazaguanine synthase
MKQAILLCSGGLDSVTTAYYVNRKYERMVLLFFNYGQRNLTQERICSKRCAHDLKAKFIEINLGYLGKISTSLLNSKMKSVKINKDALKQTKKESAKWYVPARNLVFLANAISLAESFLIKEKIHSDILVGFKNEGEDFYPDTTKDFLNALNSVSRKSTKGMFKVFAPLIKKDKEDIAILSKKLGVDIKKTYSCYVGGNKHCGTCLACKLRQQGFYWANMDDPTQYLEQ